MITVYAATTFAIIDLLSNIEEPLGLPDWTLAFAIVILSIGFIIAVIVSWIYDFHPLGGIVKTVPAKRNDKVEVPIFSNSWKIASYISFVVIVGLIVLNIIPRIGKKEIIDKSIAVLPFIDVSPGSENTYNIDGYRIAVHNNLCQIKELRVLALQSTEQYRNQTKTIPEIASELGVGYILSATGQILNNIIQLTVQLEDANGITIWSQPYSMKIESMEDHVDIQSNIAQQVAGKLQATITPEEKKRIETTPTTDLTAYDFYSQGKTQLSLYLMDKTNREALNNAEKNYNKALQYDSTYALAYAGLGTIYSEKLTPSAYSENIRDTVLIFANMALQYDPQLSEAYVLRGIYYSHGNPEKAIREFNLAIEYNPNDWRAYSGKANVYFNEELLLAIENATTALSLKGGGAELPDLLTELGYQFFIAGFPELAIKYYTDAVELNGDSSVYYRGLGAAQVNKGNYARDIQYTEKAYLYDTLNIDNLGSLFEGYQRLGKYKESFVYCKKYIRLCNSIGGMTRLANRVGFVFDHLGDHDSAEFYYNLQIKTSNNTIDSGEGRDVYYAYYDRACVNAYRGEDEEAMEDLRKFNQMKKIPQWMVLLIKNDPMIESIRDEPGFQQIVRDVEAKYQAEHDRVQQWLEENDML